MIMASRSSVIDVVTISGPTAGTRASVAEWFGVTEWADWIRLPAGLCPFRYSQCGNTGLILAWQTLDVSDTWYQLRLDMGFHGIGWVMWLDLKRSITILGVMYAIGEQDHFTNPVRQQAAPIILGLGVFDWVAGVSSDIRSLSNRCLGWRAFALTPGVRSPQTWPQIQPAVRAFCSCCKRRIVLENGSVGFLVRRGRATILAKRQPRGRLCDDELTCF